MERKALLSFPPLPVCLFESELLRSLDGLLVTEVASLASIEGDLIEQLESLVSLKVVGLPAKQNRPTKTQLDL